MLLCIVLIALVSQLASHTEALTASSIRINSVGRRHVDEVQFVEPTLPLTFSWLPDLEQPLQLPIPRAVKQSCYTLTLQQLTPPRFELEEEEEEQLKWSSGRVDSSSHVHVSYDGPTLKPDTTYKWSIEYCINMNKDCSTPTTGLIHTTIQDWQNATFIGHSSYPLTQYRRKFVLPSASSSSSISEATLYVATLGLSEIEINGNYIDATRKLDPVWTAYELRNFYSAFNVTSFLSSSSPSTNVIGVWLGSGWFSQEQYIGPSISEPNYINSRFQLLLTVTFTDGTSFSLISESTTGLWQGRVGPILHDSIYAGEHFDARLHFADWTVPTAIDAFPNVWMNAQTLGHISSTGSQLTLLPAPPIRASDDGVRITPVARISAGMNVWIFDMGQNFAGWASIKFRGPKGVQITIRYSEIMEQRFSQSIYANYIYTDNLRSATATDTFVLAGTSSSSSTGYELYEPRFTYHGFRYVQVMGSFVEPQVGDVEGVIVHSWNKQTSQLVFNQTVLNQIQHAVMWGSQSNMMGVMSDCANRDERKGWMGDAGLTVDEIMYNFDSAAFYQSFALQILDAQHADGSVPDTVPHSFGDYPADPNWGHAYPLIVSSHYAHFGDLAFVQQHYNGVRGWITYLQSRYETDGGLKQFYTRYGDWVPPPPQTQTNSNLISSFAFLSGVNVMISLATVVQNAADVTLFTALYNKLTIEFHSTFYDTSKNVYADSKQTAQAMALSLPQVVPAALRDTVLLALVNDVKANGNHFTTGILGVKELFPVLATSNYSNVAFDLLLQTSYPSYGYMFNNPYENATTLWELWDSPSEDGGMNSRNHHMFGSIGSFLHRYVAGIQINHFDSLSSSSPSSISTPVRIEPLWVDARVNYVKDELQTMYGTYMVEWKRTSVSDEEDSESSVDTVISVFIPPNAVATLTLPSPTPSRTMRCQRLTVADVVPTMSKYDDEEDVEERAVMKAVNPVVLLERRVVNGEWVLSRERVNEKAGMKGIESMIVHEDGEERVTIQLASGNYQFSGSWA